MPEQYAAPIDHSATSAIATTTAGAAGGAIKKGLIGGALGFALPIIGGAALLGGLPFIALGGLALIHIAGPALLATGAAAVAGAVAGGVMFSGPGAAWGASLGGLYGGYKGGVKSANQVKEEIGASNVLKAQVEAARAQAQGAEVTNVYAPSTSATNNNKFGFAEQGTALNPASTTLQAGNDNRQYEGAVTSQQRAASI